MGLTRWHWQGKLRGVEFEPLTFRIGLETAPVVRDVKGRLVPMPALTAVPTGEFERREQGAADNRTKVLEALRDNPGASLADLATASGVPKTSVDRKLKRLASVMGDKAVVQAGEKWSITKAGLEMLESEKPDAVVGG
jgi:Winged helix-turn-helix DNA-binding